MLISSETLINKWKEAAALPGLIVSREKGDGGERRKGVNEA
jgi:hypothetical protein